MSGDERERECPYCGASVASVQEEIAHMNAQHPGIVSQRLVDAGIHPDEIADYRSGPDLPSILTLRELGLLLIFAERYAPENVDSSAIDIGVLVRDRGRDGRGLKAPWVEFSVNGRQFALWRNTLDLYEVGPDGAIGDDPIHRND